MDSNKYIYKRTRRKTKIQISRDIFIRKIMSTQEEQLVDLTEITRQQAEYIIELQMELVELTDKWEFVKEELDGMRTQKILEEGM